MTVRFVNYFSILFWFPRLFPIFFLKILDLQEITSYHIWNTSRKKNLSFFVSSFSCMITHFDRSMNTNSM